MIASITRIQSHIFFTDDLMSSMSEKRFSFSTFVSFGNSQKSAEPNQENTADYS
jgi:hypothetical protein